MLLISPGYYENVEKLVQLKKHLSMVTNVIG